MIGTFARLKLRLLRNVLRTSDGLGLVVFTFAAVVLGASSAVWIRTVRLDIAIAAAPVLTAGLLLGWALAPLMFGASDETIDPHRLALFPLRTRPLAAGVLAAGLIGPGPIAACLPALALTSRAPGPTGILLGAAATAAMLLTATILSRWLLTSFGSWLRRRRGRDLATLVAGLTACAFGIGMQLLTLFGGDMNAERFLDIAPFVRWIPLAWSGDALGRVAAGEYLVPLVEVVLSSLLILVAFDRWSIALARSLTEVDEGSTQTRLGRPLLGRTSRLDKISPRVAAVLAKERRYLTRHPRYRVQIVSQGTVLLVGGAPFISAVVNRNPEATLLGCIPGLTAGVTGSNLLGSDGRALWGEAVALPTLRPLLRGRSMAFIILGIVLSVVLSFAVGAWTDGWSFIPAALGASIGMAFAGAGIGSYTSVLAPTPFPEDNNPNPFAGSSPGGGCLNGIATFVGVLVGLVAAAPMLYGLSLAQENPRVGLAVSVLSPIYGMGLWTLMTSVAGRRLDRRLPELLSALSAT